MNLPHPGYLLLVGASVAIALAFPVTRHIRQESLRRQYYILQGITLLGAIAGAKLSVLFGDHGWPLTPVTDWWAIVWSGRSITGALICGFLAAEIAKPLMGYKMPPNDRFATVLPFTVAIGRIGCLTAGCCYGIPYAGWCAVQGADGVSRYPTQVFEIILQISVGILFILMVRRGLLYGRLFSFYLVVYGLFRFATEYIRATPKTFGGLSGYQLLAVVMIILGAGFFFKRTLVPPKDWKEFQKINGTFPNNHPQEVEHV